MGYATEVHHDAILEHGVCELHRMSFASVAYQQLGLLDVPPIPARGVGRPARARRGGVRAGPDAATG